MNKQPIVQQVIAQLEAELGAAERAALSAHETATHEENIAENKYDTLGLEAAYLAAGQARRVEAIGQRLRTWRQLQLRDHDDARGIRLTALVQLEDEHQRSQWLFIGPDGAGLKVRLGAHEVRVINPEAPLGQRLLGRQIGDEIVLQVTGGEQCFEVLAAY
ncbi:GreA/GreB family elongation factor [Phytopseudomonas dryadis]|uniref:Transcription elongation factor GreAB n=1 Tax=Phytopseudomonas dryadis TaxID=2487520 RepID=A0A4Q9QVB6_9GAMM|nr:GreA/GreB family elongation factor [Pseudomonas dryadis]TBU87649.1 transcription elongation factor GreAB [Pseudomonas dryadis]